MTIFMAILLSFLLSNGSSGPIDISFIVNNFTSNIQKLVTAEGSFSKTIRYDTEVFAGDGFFAADYLADKIRYDYYQKSKVYVPDRAGSLSPDVRIRGGKYVRTREYSLHTNLGSEEKGAPSVGIWKSDQKPGSDIGFFDFRMVGLCFNADIELNRPYTELVNEIANYPCTVEQVKDGLYKFSRHSKDVNGNSVDWYIWFARDSGYCPVRSEFYIKISGDALTKISRTTSEVSWKQFNGVWLPVSYRISSQPKVNRGAESYSHEINIMYNWKEVNSGVNPKLFEDAGLGLKENSYHLIDHRLGKPVLIKQAGWKPGEAKLEVRMQDQPASFSGYIPWIIVAAILFVLFFVILLVRKRRLSQFNQA
jgi:hypothetical protein